MATQECQSYVVPGKGAGPGCVAFAHVAVGAAMGLLGAIPWHCARAQITELHKVEVVGERSDTHADMSSAWGDRTPPSHLTVSATAIDAQVLDTWQARRLEDLTGLVPGMVVEPLNAGLSTAVKLRGFALTRLHYNGLPDIQRMFARDMVTVERVEVLRGPSALVYGITSPGGVVNYVGKRPSATPHDVLGMSVGNDGFARLTADSTGHLGGKGSTWTYRAVAALQDGTTSLADLPTRRSQGLVALTWAYAAGGQVTLDLEDQRNQTPFTFGTVIINGGAPGAAVKDAQVQYDRLYVVPGGAPAMRRYHQSGVDWEQRLDSGWRLAAQYQQAVVTRDEELLGYWTLVSPTSLSGYYTRYHDSYRQHGLRVTAQRDFITGRFAHQAIVGADGYRQGFHFEGVQSIGAFSLDVAQPDFSGVHVSTLPTARRYNDERVAEQALWVADRVSVNGQTELTIGVRRQSYTIASDRTGSGRKPVGDASATTGHLGLSVALDAQWRAYASVSTGMEPNRGMTHQGAFLPPQNSRQVEAGSHWQWAPRANFHAAVYEVDLSNLAMTDPADRTAVISSGRRRVQGLEWSADVGVEALRLQGNLSAMRTRQLIKTSASLGDEFAGAPRRSAGLQLQGDLRSLTHAESLAWLGVTAVGPRMGDAANTVRVAGYARVDAGARMNWPGGHALQCGVRNLANLRYVESVTAVDDVFQGPLRQLWLTYTISR